jgi:mono/diheme cytochrome c family protein
MKLADDPQPDVRLQFALTISALGLPQTDRAAASILQRSSNPPYVQDAVISGLRGRELEFLTTLLQEDDTPVDADADPSTLKALAECVVAERLPRRVAALLELAARQGPEVHWRRDAILAAFPARSTQSAARRQKGIMLDAEPPAIARLRIDDPSDLKRPLANVLAMVHWPGQKGYQPPPPPRPLSSEELSRFENGRAVYAATCLQCHKSTGLGQEGLAPPLLDSEWALGPESRVIRIVLHGLNGPITVAGRTHMLDMPALGSLKDADIAAVLTFVRRSWDHEADPVDPSTVAHIRALESQRTTPWTERELLNIR